MVSVVALELHPSPLMLPVILVPIAFQVPLLPAFNPMVVSVNPDKSAAIAITGNIVSTINAANANVENRLRTSFTIYLFLLFCFFVLIKCCLAFSFNVT